MVMSGNMMEHWWRCWRGYGGGGGGRTVVPKTGGSRPSCAGVSLSMNKTRVLCVHYLAFFNNSIILAHLHVTYIEAKIICISFCWYVFLSLGHIFFTFDEKRKQLCHLNTILCSMIKKVRMVYDTWK